MDQYADDLAELIAELDLRDVVLVGHSRGGGAAFDAMGTRVCDNRTQFSKDLALPCYG